MRYRYGPAYLRTIARVKDRKRLEEIHETIKTFQDTVEKSNTSPSGLGLKRLRGSIWEFRAGPKTRILIKWTMDLVEYGIVGTHDEIRNYLKHI